MLNSLFSKRNTHKTNDSNLLSSEIPLLANDGTYVPGYPHSMDVSSRSPPSETPLLVDDGTYHPSVATTHLLDEIGGIPALMRMMTIFYDRVFDNSHLEPFFQFTVEEPHGERLAHWVAEKMGGLEGKQVPVPDFSSGFLPKTNDTTTTDELASSVSLDTIAVSLSREETTEVPSSAEDMLAEDRSTKIIPTSFPKIICPRGVVPGGIKNCPLWQARHPWSTEREMTRDLTPKKVKVITRSGESEVVVHDRSSAHVAGWHSPKRESGRIGDHFKLDEVRVWMRLHFWACREAGLFPLGGAKLSQSVTKILKPSTQQRFCLWYTRFIAHFSRIYEREAPVFAMIESKWSLSGERLQKYEAAIEAGLSKDGARPKHHGMEDVVGIRNARTAMSRLPEEDIDWIFEHADWPYR